MLVLFDAVMVREKAPPTRGAQLGQEASALLPHNVSDAVPKQPKKKQKTSHAPQAVVELLHVTTASVRQVLGSVPCIPRNVLSEHALFKAVQAQGTWPLGRLCIVFPSTLWELSLGIQNGQAEQQEGSPIERDNLCLVVYCQEHSTDPPMYLLDCGSKEILQAFKFLLVKEYLSVNLAPSGTNNSVQCLIQITVKNPLEDPKRSTPRMSAVGSFWIRLKLWMEELGISYLQNPQTESLSEALHEGVNDAGRLYALVRPVGNEPVIRHKFPSLKVQLRPYQARAVAWMVKRELNPPKMLRNSLWIPVVDLNEDGEQISGLSFNVCTGAFTAGPARIPSPVHGGILADEMGLGKTVELLACLMAHRYTGPAFVDKKDAVEKRSRMRERTNCICGAKGDDGNAAHVWVQCKTCNAWQHAKCVNYSRHDQRHKKEFICGDCEQAMSHTQVTQPCGATLIVCPQPILPQWQEEIYKHTVPGALKVKTYEGAGKGKGRTATAAELAEYDIVLTTYDVLADDIWHNPSGEETRNLRHQKRYKIVATPLTRLVWWRVCLDEAQMVRNGTAAAAQLASQIQAKHRWAVTGTPVNHGVADIFGLLVFLNCRPFDERFWWLRACEKPIEHGSPSGWETLRQLLAPSAGGLLWRSSKADVAHELGLLEQKQIHTNLQLSAIERHFYDRQHEHCFNAARSAFGASFFASVQQGEGVESEQAQRGLTAKEEKALLGHLLRLRQACCHPQVGAGGIKQLQPKVAPMTMGQVLEVLMRKSKVEAEEGLRLLLYSMNGLASLHAIEKHVPQAIEQYRTALRSVEKYKGTLKADSLQQLHAIHNLHLLLAANKDSSEVVAPTLRDSELGKQAEAIREKYMAAWWAKLHPANKDFKEALEGLNSPPAPGAEAPPGDESSPSAGDESSPGAESSKHVTKGGSDEEESWFLAAIDMLQKFWRDPESDPPIDKIRLALAEWNSDGVRLTKNATSLAKRILSPNSLKVLLLEQMRLMKESQDIAIQELRNLSAATEALDPATVSLAARCGRCRFEHQGEAGQECRHCKLDDLIMAWELRLFDLQTHATNKQGAVTAEDALLQARQIALRRVGRGGLGEAVGVGDPGGDEVHTTRAGQAAVSNAEVVHRPSEAEQLLKIIASHLRALKGLPPNAAENRQIILEEAKEHLEKLDAVRKLFFKARALSLPQRFLLYAKDELEQCTMRMRLRYPGEVVKPHDAHFKLFPEEVPLKFKELENEQALAEAELNKSLGKMRFLEGQRTAATQEMSPVKQGKPLELGEGKKEEEEEEGLRCPVCLTKLLDEFTVLPCGHSLCRDCSYKLIIKHMSSPNSSQGGKPECPTCRQSFEGRETTHVSSKAQAVDTKQEPDNSSSSSVLEKAESKICVRGSQSTKVEAVVRRVMWLLQQDKENRILVFSTWPEVLTVVAFTLKVNKVDHFQVHRAGELPAAISALHTAVQNPQASGAVRVVLLPIKHGANGLNFTDAQHVILIEPLVDAAVEAQAIGRIHRIGQTRETFVHKFVVSESVEENVSQLNRERALHTNGASERRSKLDVDPHFSVRDVAMLLQNLSPAKKAAGGESASIPEE